MDTCYFEYTLGQSTGLVKYDVFCLGQSLQIVGAFDQDTCVAGPADSGKETQRDTDHKCTRAADYKEGQCTVDPLAPHCRIVKDHKVYNRRQDCKCERTVADCRGIIAGKFGDKVFGSGFTGTGFLDQFQDLGNGRFIKFFGCSDLEHACHVDAAADDLITWFCTSRKTFTCQCTGIEGCGSFYDHTVERDFFTWLYDDDGTDLNFIRVNFFQFTIVFDIGVVRADIHQFGDVAAALADRIALEKLADLVEQHNGCAFFVILQKDCSDSCYCHQEVLVKYLFVADSLECFDQDIIADHKIWDHVKCKFQIAVNWKHGQYCDQYESYDDAGQHFFLLFVHVLSSFTHLIKMPCRIRSRAFSLFL